MSPRFRRLFGIPATPVALAVRVSWVILLLGRAADAGPVAACIGDRDGDGRVAVSELVLMVNAALDKPSAAPCAAGDVNQDGRIRIDEILLAVNVALRGCVATPAPTSTPSPTPTGTVPPQNLTLTDVTIINPGQDRREHRTITIVDGVIVSIRDDQSRSSGAGSLGAGSYVLPGLIDMHVHHPQATPEGYTQLFSVLYLLHGVTTVRDMGNFDRSIFTTRQRIRAGEFRGPRIFACGEILDGDPPVWPGSCVVRNGTEARACVARQVEAGADCIKVYEGLSEESLAAIRDAAAMNGLPVIGHVPQASAIERAGLADVQHLTGVPPFDLPTGTSYLDWWVDAWQRVDDARIEFIVQTSLAQGIVHTPTITVWDRLSRTLASYDSELNDPAMQLLPRVYRILWNPSRYRVKPETVANFPAVLERMREVVRRLHEAGVRIHAGTDTLNPFVVPGASLHEELAHLVAAGFTTEEAWAAATRSPGEFLGQPMLGTVQEGAPADVLLFSNDPTHDLQNLSALGAVVANGRYYSKDELARAAADLRDRLDSTGTAAILASTFGRSCH